MVGPLQFLFGTLPIFWPKSQFLLSKVIQQNKNIQQNKKNLAFLAEKLEPFLSNRRTHGRKKIGNLAPMANLTVLIKKK